MSNTVNSLFIYKLISQSCIQCKNGIFLASKMEHLQFLNPVHLRTRCMWRQFDYKFDRFERFSNSNLLIHRTKINLASVRLHKWTWLINWYKPLQFDIKYYFRRFKLHEFYSLKKCHIFTISNRKLAIT